jgi:hypothetical protein
VRPFLTNFVKIARGDCPEDFTKQYNRLRQHVAVRTGTAQGVASSISHSTVVAAIPAVNRPKAADTIPSQTKYKTTDQLAILSKYSSRIAKIDIPYKMGVSVNRKGPSSYANAKDKSDRATSEQVLDPRTRIILFKMIGRGLIHEVNGCVSTGKEVRSIVPLSRIGPFTFAILPSGQCLPCTDTRLSSFCSQDLQDLHPRVQRQR